MGIVAVLVVGIGLVVYGAIWDRTSNKLRRQQLRSAPAKPIPGLPTDADEPAYVHPSDLVEQRPEPVTEPDVLAALRERMDAAPSLPHGHMVATFATHAGDLCVLERPASSSSWTAELATIRELLPVADHAKKLNRPLAVVAAALSDDVLHTLEANTLAATLQTAAVAIPESDQRRQFASLVGAVPCPARRSQGRLGPRPAPRDLRDLGQQPVPALGRRRSGVGAQLSPRSGISAAESPGQCRDPGFRRDHSGRVLRRPGLCSFCRPGLRPGTPGSRVAGPTTVVPAPDPGPPLDNMDEIVADQA